MTQRPLISVICCAHNEEGYIDGCMPNLVKGFPFEIMGDIRSSYMYISKAKRLSYDLKVTLKTVKKLVK